LKAHPIWVRLFRYLTMKNTFLLAFSAICTLHFSPLAAQNSGCTDPLANNYSSAANNNDGSCQYNSTTISTLLLHNLSTDLNECSGLALKDGQWWALNDGGNDPQLLRINPADGSILQRVRLLNAVNVDWEDLSTDGEAFYIGDFGNNATGNRMDLGVYRLPFWAITDADYLEVGPDDYEYWPMAYVDQLDFTPAANDNELVFDCEAMLHFNGELHFFTKNWSNRTTTQYTLTPGSAIAQRRNTFDVDGLITGAAISPDSQVVVLSGYEIQGTASVFVWVFWNFTGDDFFSGHKRRFELGSLISQGQCEAVAFTGARQGILGSERLAFGSIELAPASSRLFDITPYILPPGTTGITGLPTTQEQFKVWPNPGSNWLYWEGNASLEGKFALYNALGQKLDSGDLSEQQLNLSALSNGNYQLILTTPTGISRHTVLKQ
jgi:hypothetical protein